MDSVATMTPQQELMNTEIDRLKKFYQGQYEVEASRFAKQKMPDKDFQEVMGKLQSKYKLAFNEAKFQTESRAAKPVKEKTAFQQFSELDTYKGQLEERLANYRWTGKPGVSNRLETWNPNLGDKGEWTSKGITTEQLNEAMNYTFELNRTKALQNALIGKPTSSLMTTAATSKRMGGSIAEQTKNYLQQKETVTQRQEPEDFSKMSDEELKRIAEGR